MTITKLLTMDSPTGWANLIEICLLLELVHFKESVHLTRFAKRITNEYS